MQSELARAGVRVYEKALPSPSVHDAAAAAANERQPTTAPKRGNWLAKLCQAEATFMLKSLMTYENA